MKTNRIEEKLKNMGFERGTLWTLESLQEQINTLSRSIKEQQQLMDGMISTLSNVVNGAAGMKQELIARMSRAGLLSPEDDLGENTKRIGEN